MGNGARVQELKAGIEIADKMVIICLIIMENSNVCWTSLQIIRKLLIVVTGVDHVLV